MTMDAVAEHDELCMLPFGAEVCTCDEIKNRREAPENPWADIMVTVHMDFEERHAEHEHTLAAARVEAASLGHTEECAAWIWADRGLKCNCGLITDTDGDSPNRRVAAPRADVADPTQDVKPTQVIRGEVVE